MSPQTDFTSSQVILKGYYSIALNQQYRIIFQWDKETKEVHDVRISD
ncbi:MAG: hypothetical protein BRC43_08470 [Cyanobacteria bacterium QS_3_48_167]|nr:MAG: hypothetical protein BRC35_07035 [Cyanobacteria bacterium QH_10_48_56]PSO87735.1 MAG: hypothetical protein BRC43_08470 [Cyanobacteria bacterium QS_3_48_167]